MKTNKIITQLEIYIKAFVLCSAILIVGLFVLDAVVLTSPNTDRLDRQLHELRH